MYRAIGTGVFLLFAVAGVLFGFGAGEQTLYTGASVFDAPDGARVEISGVVRVVGSDPFPEVVITTEDGTDWHVRPESQVLLIGRERDRVTVKATLHYRELMRADGVLLGRRRELDELQFTESE